MSTLLSHATWSGIIKGISPCHLLCPRLFFRPSCPNFARIGCSKAVKTKTCRSTLVTGLTLFSDHSRNKTSYKVFQLRKIGIASEILELALFNGYTMYSLLRHARARGYTWVIARMLAWEERYVIDLSIEVRHANRINFFWWLYGTDNKI